MSLRCTDSAIASPGHLLCCNVLQSILGTSNHYICCASKCTWKMCKQRLHAVCTSAVVVGAALANRLLLTGLLLAELPLVRAKPLLIRSWPANACPQPNFWLPEANSFCKLG